MQAAGRIFKTTTTKTLHNNSIWNKRRGNTNGFVGTCVAKALLDRVQLITIRLYISLVWTYDSMHICMGVYSQQHKIAFNCVCVCLLACGCLRFVVNNCYANTKLDSSLWTAPTWWAYTCLHVRGRCDMWLVKN